MTVTLQDALIIKAFLASRMANRELQTLVKEDVGDDWELTAGEIAVALNRVPCPHRASIKLCRICMTRQLYRAQSRKFLLMRGLSAVEADRLADRALAEHVGKLGEYGGLDGQRE